MLGALLGALPESCTDPDDSSVDRCYYCIISVTRMKAQGTEKLSHLPKVARKRSGSLGFEPAAWCRESTPLTAMTTTPLYKDFKCDF